MTLLEMHKDFDRDFRGNTIHPSILELLDQIGLVDRLHRMPHSKANGLTVEFASGPFRMFDLSRLKTRYRYTLIIPPTRFLEFITQEAATYPQFKLLMRAQVRQLVEENGVVVGVRYLGGDGADHEIRAKLTVGADGRFSVMRRLAGFEPIKATPTMDVVWFRLAKFAGEPETTAGARAGVGPGCMFVALEHDDHWQVGMQFPKGQYQAWRLQGVDVVRRNFAEAIPQLAKHAESLTDWNQTSLLSVESSLCPVWHKPGLLLIGDAAHAMGPMGGVGINYAVMDAVVATNILTGPLLASNVTDTHLAEVQRQREGPTRAIQRLQARMGRPMGDRTLRPTRPNAPPWQLRLLMKIPVLRDIPSRMIALGPRRVRLEEL